MPELRQNFFTKEWVIIATERAKRPEELATHREPQTVPSFVESCPFCPGNESQDSARGHAVSCEYGRALGCAGDPQQVRCAFKQHPTHAQPAARCGVASRGSDFTK